MSSTTYVDYQPPAVNAAWLNDVDRVTYDNDGADYVKFTQTNGTARSVQQKLKDYISVKDYGAVGDGITDDSGAIQTAINSGAVIDFRSGTYKIGTTLTLPANCTLYLQGTTIVAATGSNPLFSYVGDKSGLYIFGGLITGTASTVLYAEGTTSTPSTIANYAREIHLNDIQISSATITTSLVLSKAVNSIYINNCNWFTQNGINANGKNVAVMIANSIIYSATGGAGTFGIKLRSNGGTSYYNEGWSVINSTIDNFDTTFDVTDVFTFQINGGYYGSITSGYLAKFQEPSTSLCFGIFIGAGSILNGRIVFIASSGGINYGAQISGCTITAVSGTAISLENNACNVTVNDVKFTSGAGTAIGVVGAGNNHNISCTNLDFDNTYQNGVVLNGAIGDNCLVGPLVGNTTGDIVGAARTTIRYTGIPITSSTIASLIKQSSASNITGTFAVSATIGSLTTTLGKGTKGRIIVNLPYSGGNASTQNIQVTVPAGMVLISGSGYSAGNLYTGAANGLLHAHLDFHCTSAISAGTISAVNQAGNSITINNQGYLALVIE